MSDNIKSEGNKESDLHDTMAARHNNQYGGKVTGAHIPWVNPHAPFIKIVCTYAHK